MRTNQNDLKQKLIEKMPKETFEDYEEDSEEESKVKEEKPEKEASPQTQEAGAEQSNH